LSVTVRNNTQHTTHTVHHSTSHLVANRWQCASCMLAACSAHMAETAAKKQLLGIAGAASAAAGTAWQAPGTACMHHPPQAAQTVLSVLLCASLLLGTCLHRCAVKHLLCDAANSVATPNPRQTCSSVPGSICQLLLYTCLLIACFSVLMVIALVMVSTLLPPATQTVTEHSAEQHVNVGAKHTALRSQHSAARCGGRDAHRLQIAAQLSTLDGASIPALLTRVVQSVRHAEDAPRFRHPGKAEPPCIRLIAVQAPPTQA
jgi:hypothetical protein